jgi:hypothetical protein
MRRRPAVVTAIVGAFVSLLACGCTGRGGGAAVGWSAARQLPVRAVVTGYAPPVLSSLWCGTPGNCIMAGSRYKFAAPPGGDGSQVFTVSEAGGSWQRPQVIAGGQASGIGVACPAAGSCVAAGNQVTLNAGRALVAIQEHGVWGTMRSPPGLNALAGPGWGTGIDALSCGAAGVCLAVGHSWPAGVYGSQVPFRPFALTEHDGAWSNAQPVPALAAQGAQQTSALSCDPAGTCTAAGLYRAHSGQAFVVSGHNGIWGQPHAITAAFGGQGSDSSIDTISCPSQGNCSAAGIAGDQAVARAPLPFVVTETAGSWGRAMVVPGAPAVGVHPGDSGFTTIAGMSCPAPGQCGLAGYSASMSSGEHDNVDASAVFVASQVHGTWTTAKPIPGLTALSHGAPAVITALSCAAPGDCAAGGSYARPEGPEHAWLAIQTHGTWSQAAAVPGLTALGGAASQVSFVACAPRAGPADAAAGECTAVGDYETKFRGIYTEHFFATASG